MHDDLSANLHLCDFLWMVLLAVKYFPSLEDLQVVLLLDVNSNYSMGECKVVVCFCEDYYAVSA